MRLANFNVRATPPMLSRRVRADLRVAKDTRAKVITWQELAKLRRYRRLLREVFPVSEGWWHYHLKRRCAITVNHQAYDVLRVRPHRLSKGRALIPQPSRWANEVVLRSHVFDDYDVAVLSVQLTNGGYNGRRRPEWNRRARQRLWDGQYEKLVEIVDRLHEEGLDVVVTGDLNRHRVRRLHKEQVDVVMDGVMHMLYIPAAGHRIERRHAMAIPEHLLFTDHAGLVATVRRLGTNVVT